MVIRISLILVFALVALFTSLVAAKAAEPWSPEDALDAREGASPRVRCIIDQEVGGARPPYDPYAVGRQGELGIAQLHPQGELLTFYRQGFTDPYNPYQATRFLEQAVFDGRARAWSPVLLGMC